MFLRFVIGFMFITTFVGCATTQKPTATNQLQIRVSRIENRLDERDQEISDLKYAVDELNTNVEKLSDSVGFMGRPSRSASVSLPKTTSDSADKGIIRVPASPQEVQTALKKAGYYEGAIDGKIGSGSQKAIREFQKDHDIQSDGIVGKQTWAQLKNYLE